MTKRDIVIYREDEWEAMYIDGKKVAEGHSINLFDLERENILTLRNSPRGKGEGEVYYSDRIEDIKWEPYETEDTA